MDGSKDGWEYCHIDYFVMVGLMIGQSGDLILYVQVNY